MVSIDPDARRPANAAWTKRLEPLSKRAKLPIQVSESSGVRSLHFGSPWVQGAMRVRRPFDLELAYTREMMAGLLLRPEPDWPGKVLLIGLGAGSLAKFFHKRLPHAHVTVVEIEPQVVAVARQHFRLPEPDKRLRVVVDDAAHFVLRGGEAYDYILADGYDRNARAGALATLPFFQAARTRLTGSGLLSANLFGGSRGFELHMRQISAAFEGRALAFPSLDTGNVVAFAATGEPVVARLAELRERTRRLKAETGLDLRPTVSRLEHAGRFEAGVLHL